MAKSELPKHKRMAMAKTVAASVKEGNKLKTGGMPNKGMKKCDGGMPKR